MIFPTWRWKHRAETDLAEARMARQETRLGELLAAIGKTRADLPRDVHHRPVKDALHVVAAAGLERASAGYLRGNSS